MGPEKFRRISESRNFVVAIAASSSSAALAVCDDQQLEVAPGISPQVRILKFRRGADSGNFSA